MTERTPASGIGHHRERLDGLSDEAFLAALLAVDPLPQGDDSDPAWDDDATWDRAELLLAIADSIGDRQLLEAIGPLFERAALGDANDAMQGIRHGPERATSQDWHVLTQIMKPLVHHDRPGCRRWAVRELGLLRDVDAIPELLAALADGEQMVRAEACMSLGMVAASAPADMVASIRERLLRVADADDSESVRRQARWSAERF